MNEKFINDANYKVEIREQLETGRTKVVWKCPIYVKWDKMKSRCSKSSIILYPSYTNKKICEEWYTFSNFSNWIHTLPFDLKYISCLELDKDIKVTNNCIYSPSTCLMVPKYINNSVIDSTAIRGSYPLGVTHDPTPRLKNTYRAVINSKYFKNKTIGRYDNAHTAHRAWQEAKINHFLYIIEEYKLEPFYYKDVEVSLQRIVNKLTYEYMNNIETMRIL